MSRCEESHVFRELKVRHRRGACVDEVGRGSLPKISMRAVVPRREGETHPTPGIFWNVSTARRRARASSFEPSSYTDGKESEVRQTLAMAAMPTDIFFVLEKKVYPICDAKPDTT